MDSEKKRKQMMRVALTESIMVVAVVVIVALLMFMVMGYSLKTGDEWSVEQSGLVQLVSEPSGASIQIDGEDIFPRTETSRMLSAGEHTVRLYRDGYTDWQKQINVRSGIFLRLKYPRLFKENRGAETAKTLEDIAWVKFSDNRRFMLYAKNDSKIWYFVDLNSNDLKEVEINTANLFDGTLNTLEWLSNNERVLVEVTKESTREWQIIDLKTPEKSVNLTEMFGMNFSDVEPLNEAGDRLWVVENGNLRQIYVSNKEASGVLASNVLSFANDKDEVVYVKKTADEKRIIETYRDGDNKPVKVMDVTDNSMVVKVAVEEYLGDTYLSLLLSQKFVGYKADDFPVVGQDFAMEKYLEQDLKSVPINFEASKNGQMVIMSNGKNMGVMDAETEQIYEYELPSDKYFWLDDYLIGTIVDGELIVYDFDGTNRRELVKASSGYPALINGNGRYLYYFRVDGDKLLLKREQL
ncbi:PEGA domain-containing protein [Candidatus Saccharibacteria bacterium]|nr:PEGA domain-containing protein [Candidatus Saccharibacteria bacterium]